MWGTVSKSSYFQRKYTELASVWWKFVLVNYAIFRYRFQAHKLQQHSSKKTNFSCELCNKTCINQLKFFEHLKSHYEPSMNAENVDHSSSAKGNYEPDVNANNQVNKVIRICLSIILRCDRFVLKVSKFIQFRNDETIFSA